MPAEHHADPTRLEAAACFDAAVPFDVAACFDAVATALARSRAAALDASHELLAHYADTGEAATQRTVDTQPDVRGPHHGEPVHRPACTAHERRRGP